MEVKIIDAEIEVLAIKFDAADMPIICAEKGRTRLEPFMLVVSFRLSSMRKYVPDYNEVGVVGHDRNTIRLIVDDSGFALRHLRGTVRVLVGGGHTRLLQLISKRVASRRRSGALRFSSDNGSCQASNPRAFNLYVSIASA